jgi:hypothetical protein
MASDSRHSSNPNRGPPVSDSKQGKPMSSMALPVQIDAGVLSPTCGTTTPPLSLPPIKGSGQLKLPPFHSSFPRLEVSHQCTHYQLASIPPRHSMIPSAWLILESLRLFCPWFCHHRPSPQSSPSDHTSTTHH